MKVLIIGIGNIGKSHLKSFFLSKKKYDIYLFDKFKINYSFINKNIFKNINITVLKKFPKSLKFDLAIISTNSLERSLILNKLHTYNKIKYFIIEKFLFTKLSHFESSKSFFHKRMIKMCTYVIKT